MHGLVVLEVFGHTSFVGGHQAEIFRMSMRILLQDLHRRIPRTEEAMGRPEADGEAPTGESKGQSEAF